ncbi:MAG: hypothetical protein Q8M76_08670 [Spirochaetaceae bacterium]|nr:hypothetical protein [Spirochaetaceae bacterium]
MDEMLFVRGLDEVGAFAVIEDSHAGSPGKRLVPVDRTNPERPIQGAATEDGFALHPRRERFADDCLF